MRVAKWGNSLAVVLPEAIVEELGVKEGDEVSVTVKVEQRNERDAMSKLSKEELLERVRGIRKKFPADFKFDREEANARR